MPDDLSDAVRRHHLAISAITQSALEAALAEEANRAWVDRARKRPVRLVAVDTAALLDEVRGSFGSSSCSMP